jgi:hypothetical protein
MSVAEALGLTVGVAALLLMIGATAIAFIDPDKNKDNNDDSN